MDYGLIELNRCWIEIQGEDSKKFLNGILTNDINKLRGESGCYSLMLTPKGKIIADCFCYACGDIFGIDCAAELKPVILETLKKYVVFQKVKIVDQSEDWKAFAVLGPKAKEFLSAYFKELPATEFSYLETNLDTIKLWIIFKKLWGLPCFEVWTKKLQAAALKTKLNLPEISSTSQEMLRIESVTPLFGIDFDQNTIPQEAELYSALSFDKGCYIGQEIVVRLEHRGHVSKQLVQLVVESPTPPNRGEKIFSEDEKEIGQITSSCFSLKYNSAIALGYVGYNFLNLSQVKVGELKSIGQIGSKR